MIGGFQTNNYQAITYFGVIVAMDTTTDPDNPTVNVLYNGNYDDTAQGMGWTPGDPPTTYLVPLPNSLSFILFVKDNTANTSSLSGYYAEAKFVNNSTTGVELFSVGSEIFESSK